MSSEGACEWGAGRAAEYTLLYVRVDSPDTTASVSTVLVYVIDSLGFRGVFRPRSISYEDGRNVIVGGRTISVPSRATLFDERGGDTLRIELTIEDAIGTDIRTQSDGILAGATDTGERTVASRTPRSFIQMKGSARISGRLDGESVAGTGTGFFETFR